MNNTYMIAIADKYQTIMETYQKEKLILIKTRALSVKVDITSQIKNELSRVKLSKGLLADRMCTSRSALDRLLDPNNLSVSLITLEKAALALNKQLKIELV
jgi:hypothetical protein